jgi:hypothetical protein
VIAEEEDFGLDDDDGAGDDGDIDIDELDRYVLSCLCRWWCWLVCLRRGEFMFADAPSHRFT